MPALTGSASTQLLEAVGPAYFQWQYGNSVAYNITGGSLSPCGNASAPARCPAEGQPRSAGKAYRVLQREDWSATLDFIAGLPNAKLSFYVASNCDVTLYPVVCL